MEEILLLFFDEIELSLGSHSKFEHIFQQKSKMAAAEKERELMWENL